MSDEKTFTASFARLQDQLANIKASLPLSDSNSSLNVIEEQATETEQISYNKFVEKALKKKIGYWRQKLLDLSRRNRLISFKEYKRTSLMLVSPSIQKIYSCLLEGQNIFFFKSDEEDEEPQLPLLTEGNRKNKKLREPPSSEANVWVSAYSSKETDKRLYYLYLNSKESLQEQGINTLFVALGYLHYFESDDSSDELRAPLLLFPVEIERSDKTRKDRHRYRIKLLEEDAQLNPAIAHKLSSEFGIKVPDFLVNGNPNEWLNSLEKIIEGKKRWKLSKESCLGIFSFQKLQIYFDLEKFAELIFQHPILQLLAGAEMEILGNFSQVPRASELDTLVKPKDIFQVVDADSSQQEAIEAAKQGSSFVIQGPPGTGKSQTIVNIIAELLAQKKKVLFVSEKMAALEVVKKRLNEAGVGRYCLELHRFKANKNEVLKQLGEQLDSRRESSLRVLPEDHFALLDATRDELNKIGDDLLKSRGNLHFSLYQARGELSKLEMFPDIVAEVDDVLEVSPDDFATRLMQLSKLEGYKEEITEYQHHPWKGIIIQQFGLGMQNQLRSLLSQLLGFLDLLTKLQDTIGKKFKFSANSPREFDKLVSFFEKAIDHPVEINVLTKTWFTEDLDQKLESLEEICNYSEFIRRETSQLKSLYRINYMDLSVTSILSKFKTKFRWPTRYLMPDYWNTRKTILAYAKVKRNFQEMRDDLDTLTRVHEDEAKMKLLVNEVIPLLNKNYNIEKVSWQECFSAAMWAQELRYLHGKLPEEFIGLLLKKDKLLKEVFRSLSEIYVRDFKPRLQELMAYFMKDMRIPETSIEETSIKNILIWLKDLEKNLLKLGPWVEFNRLIGELSPPVKSYVLNFLSEVRQPAYLVNGYKKQFYRSFIEAVDKDVLQLSGDYLADQVLKFQNIDSQLCKLARVRLVTILEESKPAKDLFVRSHSSELTILMREILKKRRHMPLRKLFAEASHVIFALKPCFMMSPLSVCQYLNPKNAGIFDAVIFDEASQIMTEDAISSIIRGKQTIIVGDSQQLPPTRFFSHLEDDNPEIEEELEDLESILDETGPRLPQTDLRWHYRSRDESLIAFSNRYFYDSRLVTFPNSEVDLNKGIEFIYVKDGIYDRGGSRKNIPEARRVVKLIEQHIKSWLKQSPSEKKSLGVVAFNIQQQQAIRDEIEFIQIQHSEYREFFREDPLEGFFVKNLENVQGDERDVMIFSLGFGHDQAGKFTLNFGPINKPEGYKRLNVAITRAREKVYLVTSFQPEEIDLSKINNRGVKMLIQYMRYAKEGIKAILSEVTPAEVLSLESPFEEAVYDKLVGKGWSVESQVGCSGYRIDLAIKNPQKKGSYILGIECDGSAYHSSQTARDRDRLRQSVLEGLGWNIHRIWSYDWMLNSAAEVDKIENKIKNLMKGKPYKDTALSGPPLEIIETTRDNVRELTFPQYCPFKANFHKSYISHDDILKIVKQESPIDIELVAIRLRKIIGVRRMGKRLRSQLTWGANTLVNEGKIHKTRNILWANEPQELSEVRISSEKNRPASLIPFPELGSLALEILRNGFSIDKSDLITEMARTFGYSRTGDEIRKHFGRSIDYLKKIGRAKEADGRIQLV